MFQDGNPTEPLVCSSGVKTSQGILAGAGIVATATTILAFIFRSQAIPIITTIATVIFNVFNDENMPKRVKIFAYAYNATFMFYSLYLLLFADQSVANTGKGLCTFFAVLGYILYLS